MEARDGRLGIDSPSGRRIEFRFTDAHGPDFGFGVATAADWSGVTDHPCTQMRQVHGERVVRVDSPLQHAGIEADAAVTGAVGVAIAVVVADCAPVAIVGTNAIGVVHAGWRGLSGGILRSAVAALREIDPGPITAYLGPAIHVECYEFGEQLTSLVERFGSAVEGRTRWGTTAFDLPAAVRREAELLDVMFRDDHSECTACSGRYWSHRGRRDTRRQALVGWIEPDGTRRG